MGYRAVIGLHGASFLHLPPYQADGESLEGFYLLAAFGKWFPKPLSNLLPPGIRPPAQKLRWSSWPWFFLAPPPFPFVAPLPAKDFLPPYLASTLVLFSLFLSFLSIRFSSLDLLAPSSVPISFCPYSCPVSPRASGHLSQFSPLSIIIAHFHQKESPGEKDLQECQLV